MENLTSQNKKFNKIGILTGGGDCPGLNAVIRAVVLTCSRSNISCVGFADGFEGLHENLTVNLEINKVYELLSIGGTILGSSNVGHFARIPLDDEVVKKSKATFDALQLDCIVCIGGDGTISIAHELSRFGIPIIGVPKTIDNDLMFTDQTFGFDSAVSIVSEALDRLHTTAASHHRIIVVEVMGRNSGWIALHSGVAGRASAIIIPEVDWTFQSLATNIVKESLHSRYSIIVVAEGAKAPTGDQISTDSRLGGIGMYLAKTLQKMVSMDVRVVVLGHVQRGGSPTSFDRILATKFGDMAGNLAAAGDYGKMVSLKGQRIETVHISGEVNIQRKVEKDNQLLQTARSTGILFGDESS